MAAYCLNFVTNHIINHIPSYAVRRGWYRHVMGVDMGTGSAVQLGCHLWSYGPRSNRRLKTRIGERTIVNRGCWLDVRSGLRIGDDVSISPEVVLLTTQHDVNDSGFALQGRAVVIGRGAVVAAGAVVTADVSPLDIVAGVPARPVGRRALDPHYRLQRPPLFE